MRRGVCVHPGCGGDTNVMIGINGFEILMGPVLGVLRGVN